MRITVLGGGSQARGVLDDLVRADEVEAVAWFDRRVTPMEEWMTSLRDRGFAHTSKVHIAGLDASDPLALRAAVARAGDVVIHMLPRAFDMPVARAALENRVHLVHTNYEGDLPRIAEAIQSAEIAVLPEMGFDPGIDLVLCSEAVRRFDSIDTFLWYGGGFPDPESARSNPLQYKITWIWEGVLHSYDRPAVLIRDGRTVSIPASEIMAVPNIRRIHIPSLGDFDAYPNMDAGDCARKLGIEHQARTVGRYTLRWKGHGAMWDTFKRLGFLETTQVPGLPEGVTPRKFMEKHLEPRLQYGADERDIAAIRIEATGLIGGKRKRCVLQALDVRDPESGLMAMNRMVGFPAAIAARMIADGTIPERGLLSPLRHVPCGPFMNALAQRGIRWTEEWSDDIK